MKESRIKLAQAKQIAEELKAQLEPSCERIVIAGSDCPLRRNGTWQEVACYGFPFRAENLRQCFLLLDRLRIAEQHGVRYQGLTFTKDLAVADTEAGRKENILDAYDILGASPDDPIELIKDVYRRKSMFYHPDKGGDGEKFKRLTQAYELVMKNRGAT